MPFMVGIHARNISLDMKNRTSVYDKPENASKGHIEVKGEMSVFFFFFFFFFLSR